MYFSENIPQIWVGDYASYNNGMLCGKWFDLTEYDDKAEFYEAINEMFKEYDKTHPLGFGHVREEPMFNDHEFIPREFIGECWISGKFWELMEVVNDKGWDEDEFNFALDCVDNYNLTYEKADLESLFEDIYITECDQYDLTYYFLTNWKGLNEDQATALIHYVDGEACISEMEMEGCKITENGSKYLTDLCVEA